MNMNLTVFPDDVGTPKVGCPAGWTVTQGNPIANSWRFYTADDGSALAGMWECTPGTFEVEYDKWEFCHVLSGRCVIIPVGGKPVTLTAGQGFVLDPGFRGTWIVEETMRKHFVFKIDVTPGSNV